MTQPSEAYELSNVVETALARALVLAAEVGRWDMVVQIAEELARRRPGQTGSKELQDSQHGTDVDAAPVANDLGVLRELGVTAAALWVDAQRNVLEPCAPQRAIEARLRRTGGA